MSKSILQFQAMQRIAVRPLGAGPCQVLLLPPSEVAYAFTGAAAPTELKQSLKSCCPLERSRVYVRTSRGVFATPYRRLASLLRDLETLADCPFVRVGRNIVANVLKIFSLDTSGRTVLAVFVSAEGRREIILISRRCWPPLRDRLLLPKRRP